MIFWKNFSRQWGFEPVISQLRRNRVTSTCTYWSFNPSCFDEWFQDNILDLDSTQSCKCNKNIHQNLDLDFKNAYTVKNQLTKISNTIKRKFTSLLRGLISRFQKRSQGEKKKGLFVPECLSRNLRFVYAHSIRLQIFHTRLV